MKYRPLTPLQTIVLQTHSDKAEPMIGAVPHGVYRSLVIRGLLRPCRAGYEITEEGRDVVSPLRWSKLSSRRG